MCPLNGLSKLGWCVTGSVHNECFGFTNALVHSAVQCFMDIPFLFRFLSRLAIELKLRRKRWNKLINPTKSLTSVTDFGLGRVLTTFAFSGLTLIPGIVTIYPNNSTSCYMKENFVCERITYDGPVCQESITDFVVFIF